MSIVFATKRENKCPACYGFGSFDLTKENIKAIPCRKCCAIHPEYFGLVYQTSSPNNYRFIILRASVPGLIAFIRWIFT